MNDNNKIIISIGKNTIKSVHSNTMLVTNAAERPSDTELN